MKKKLIIIGIVTLVFVLIGFYAYSRDNIRFKLSYESINQIEYNNGKKIKVNIPLDNRVKYISGNKLIDLLKNGTGVVYFGYNTCPWCRNAVPILIDTIIENDISTLYYVDIHGAGLNSVDKELYEILDPYLRENDEGEKGLAVPDLYVVKKGKILSHHIGTVTSYKNPYKGMSDSEKQELKDIYNDMIKELK